MSGEGLTVRRGEAPLVISLPHTGTTIPPEYERRLVSPWRSRKDTDWWVDQLYGFVADELGATVVHTAISRTVIDVNRDPSGISLYPGQTTTGLCPTETFDGEPLYIPGQEPTPDDIADRRRRFFDPYHETLEWELARLLVSHRRVVLYDCHSIRSVIPRLFDGELPQFNLGTHDRKSCDPWLTKVIERVCDATGLPRVTNGRFKGGYITRHYGRPTEGVHAIQMELACRGYMHDPAQVVETNWPSPFTLEQSGRMQQVLREVLAAAVAWARRYV